MSIDIYSLVCGIFFGIIVVIVAYIIHGGYKEYKQIREEYFRNELRILYDCHHLMLKRVVAIEKRLAELESDDNDEQTD